MAKGLNARVLVVLKRSAYDQYVRRHRMTRVRALLRAGDASVARLVRADRHHAETVVEVREALSALGVRARFRDRAQLGNVDEFDLIVTIGGDGTLLSTSHSVGTTPMLGINSAPLDSVGYLCGAKRGAVRAILRDALQGRAEIARVARMRVAVDGRVVHSRVLNDVLFAHRNPAMTSRFLLRYAGRTKEYKSSGVWIATAAGSTAAIHSAGGQVLSLRSRSLQFVVREPYRPPHVAMGAVRGLVTARRALEIHNKMREAALFIDGPRTVVPVEIGERVTFEVSDEPLSLVAFRHRVPT